MRLAGQRYHYLDSAAESQFPGSATLAGRPVILCVHGNPTWSFYWRRVIERFGRDHRVIAVDHLGCGRSDKPTRRSSDYTLTGHRDRLLALIDHLKLQRIVLVAHDWGGAIGLAAAVERVESMAGVVLLNTAAFPPPYVPLRIAACRIPGLGSAMVRGLNAFARAAITMAMNKNSLPADVAAGLLAPYGSWADRVGIDAFVRDIPLTSRHPTHAVLSRLEAELDKLADVPKRLIWGMRDWCFRPECLERFLEHWPTAEAIRLEEGGHYVLEDEPEAVLAAIAEFLTKVTPAGSGDGG